MFHFSLASPAVLPGAEYFVWVAAEHPGTSASPFVPSVPPKLAASLPENLEAEDVGISMVINVKNIDVSLAPQELTTILRQELQETLLPVASQSDRCERAVSPRQCLTCLFSAIII